MPKWIRELLRDTGESHDVTVREKKYEVEIKKPKDGDVYLLGGKIELQGIVKENGTETKIPPKWHSSSGEVKEVQDKQILELGREGEVIITGSYEEDEKNVTIQVVKPQVVEIAFQEGPEGGNLYNLYDHKDGARVPPAYKVDFGKEEPSEHKPACYKFGTAMKMKVKLKHDKTLANDTKVDIGGFVPDVDDENTPKTSESWSGKPVVFALEESKKKEGEAVKDWSGEIELTSSRPLPFKIGAYKWDIEWKYRINTEAAGWTHGEKDDDKWIALKPSKGVKVFAVWNEAKIGDGQDYDASLEPLKTSEYDAFHVEKSCTWACETWNLLLEDNCSIPYKGDNMLRHYRHPDDYEGKEGKPASAHDKPTNYDKLSGNAIYYSNGKACGRCGGTMDYSGTCGSCGRRKATDIVCSKCNAPFNEDHSICEACRMYVGRWLGDGFRCPKCYYTNPDDVVYCEKTLKYFNGSKLPDKKCPICGDHDVKELDHCIRCKSMQLRAKVKCPGCNQFFPERDILTGKHMCSVDPTMEVDEQDHFNGKNWGWKVFDNPTNPGGRCNQQASLIAAVLNTLGVKAKCRMLKARENGALNTSKHDPTTRGASCFNMRGDWGWNFHGITGVPVDKSRDSEFSGKKVHEDEEICFDGSFSSPCSGWPPSPGGGRKHATAKDSCTTGHDLKQWDMSKRSDNKCRCNHEMKDSDKSCPTCGAQPHWEYKCGKCGAALGSRPSYNCPSCNIKLRAIYAESIMYTCPGCDKTVHENDPSCWSCGAALPKRNIMEDWT
jgi:hypothetical protein